MQFSFTLLNIWSPINYCFAQFYADTVQCSEIIFWNSVFISFIIAVFTKYFRSFIYNPSFITFYVFLIRLPISIYAKYDMFSSIQHVSVLLFNTVLRPFLKTFANCIKNLKYKASWHRFQRPVKF